MMTNWDPSGTYQAALSALQDQIDQLRGTHSANTVFGELQTSISSFGFCQGPFTLEIDAGAPDIVSIFIPDWIKTILRAQVRWQQKPIRVPYAANTSDVSPGNTGQPVLGGTRIVAAGTDGGNHVHNAPAGGGITTSEVGEDTVASATHTHGNPVTHHHAITTAIRDLTLPGGINILCNVDSVLKGSSASLSAGPIDIIAQLIDGKLSQPGGKGPLYGYHDVQFTAAAAAPEGIRLDVFFDFFVMGKPLHV